MITILCREHRFEQIEAVLFDKDGTLASVEPYLIALGKTRADRLEQLVPNVRDNILSTFGILSPDRLASEELTSERLAYKYLASERLASECLAFAHSSEYLDPAGLMAVGSRADNEVAAAAYVAAQGIGWMAALALVRKAFDEGAARLPVKAKQTPLLPGAIALLQQLRTYGTRVGIVSADAHREVSAFINHHQLPIDWYCGADGAALTKPQAGFLSFACETMGVSPSKTLIVGDSAADLVLSQQGSAGFIGMVGGWRSAPSFAEEVAIATHLSQVQAYRE